MYRQDATMAYYPHLLGAMQVQPAWSLCDFLTNMAGGQPNNVVAVYCSMLGVCCGILGYTGVYWDILWYTGVYWDILWYTGVYWDILLYTGVYWDILLYTGI